MMGSKTVGVETDTDCQLYGRPDSNSDDLDFECVEWDMEEGGKQEPHTTLRYLA